MEVNGGTGEVRLGLHTTQVHLQPEPIRETQRQLALDLLTAHVEQVRFTEVSQGQADLFDRDGGGGRQRCLGGRLERGGNSKRRQAECRKPVHGKIPMFSCVLAMGGYSTRNGYFASRT